MSWVILGGILLDLLSVDGGLINQFIGIFGMNPIFFLGDSDWFRVTVIVSDVWKDFGFSAIIFLAALAGINPSLYEAAIVDGANRLQQVLHITLPSLLPITIVVATLALGNILNAGLIKFLIYITHLFMIKVTSLTHMFIDKGCLAGILAMQQQSVYLNLLLPLFSL